MLKQQSYINKIQTVKKRGLFTFFNSLITAGKLLFVFRYPAFSFKYTLDL